MKRLLLLLTPFVLAGCLADDSSPEACRYDANKALDQGRWDRAINLLQRSSCRSAYSDDERLLNLAAAHIGRAGYDIVDVLEELIDNDDGDASDRLIEAFSRMGASRSSLSDLDRAQRYHLDMWAGAATSMAQACSNPDHLGTLHKDACLFNGLMAAAKTGNTIGLLVGTDDLSTWLSGSTDGLSCTNDRNDNGTVDTAEITACSLQAALAGGTSGTCTNGIAWEVEGPLPEGLSELNFVDNVGNTVATATPYRFTVAAAGACAGEDDKESWRLIDQQEVLVTSGFCARTDLNSEYAEANPQQDIWPCPVLNGEGNGSLTVTNTLITALNEDADTLISVLPASQREDAKENIDDLRRDICNDGTASGCTQDADGKYHITPAALEHYLENRS
ncbi:hypothetical protein CAI21_08295 [Alkalilimnicola ehrlichii]|uniref:Lipoprotein n=1 Tax=Alkalilimnicola ehrlichii TaxID=351052 RepID=A0A3E0WWN4_9GAMM|nr:hypothetical protein [Alkalilimnicola ehrlichii]RFA29828.1 hypothetical protein CAI21_08295 [Alkalilimnicola ehrlichii]RFA36416.1 hypothetical protein CAL65_10565 [Alkalilimnicola ehrlichii]